MVELPDSGISSIRHDRQSKLADGDSDGASQATVAARDLQGAFEAPLNVKGKSS